MLTRRATIAALAASLAVPSAAFAKSERQAETDARQKAADAAHEKGTAAPLNDEQRKAIGDVWTRNQLEQSVASIGTSKGKSKEVKSLAKTLADDQRHVADDLAKRLRDRGVDPASLPPSPDQQRIQADLGAVSKASGDAFDQQFMEFLTRNTQSFKEAAGRARDATPGSDADLKWYLDQVERLQIAHRDAARQLAAARQTGAPAQQTQARTPPRPAPAPPAGH